MALTNTQRAKLRAHAAAHPYRVGSTLVVGGFGMFLIEKEFATLKEAQNYFEERQRRYPTKAWHIEYSGPAATQGKKGK